MKKLILTAIISVLIIGYAAAQDKVLTLKDAIYQNASILPKGLRNIQWKGNTDVVTYNDKKAIVAVDVKTNKQDTIIYISDIKQAYLSLTSDTMMYLISYKWNDVNTLQFEYNNAFFTYQYLKKELVKIASYPAEAENVDFEPNTKAVAYTKGNNLYVMQGEKETAVSTEENPGIVYGKEVHRREFGIYKGTFWSPKGNYLAFYRKDETMVSDYPLVDITQRVATLKPDKYPMAGMTSHQVTLGIYDVMSGAVVYIKSGEPKDQYLTSVTWSPDEKFMFIALLNRDQNHLKLNKYDARTGELLQTLFEEKDEKYVEPEHELYFVPSNPNQFIWFSERNGYDNLYLYNTDGKMLKNLVNKDIVVTELYGFDAKGQKAFFEASPANTIVRYVYYTDLTTGEVRQLTALAGEHRGIFNQSGTLFVDNFSSHSQQVYNRYEVVDLKGKVLSTLLDAPNPLVEYNIGNTQIINLKADDGTPLFGYLITPPNLDINKKYPALVYVYGGPHAQLVTDSWLAGAGMFLNYLAQKGYVVITIDNRGSANRGKAFEQAIFRNLGTVELSDQMKGVEYLYSLPYVDKERIGVDGWSYGGFMTISLMLKHPSVFRVATAGGPVIDWKYYEVMYGERYMDTPETNYEGYENANLLNYMDSLKGKLMIIHGAMDNTVVWQHSLAFLKKCIDKGVQVDYFVYPTHEHNVRGIDRMHLYKKLENYYEDYLKN